MSKNIFSNSFNKVGLDSKVPNNYKINYLRQLSDEPKCVNLDEIQ